MICLPNVKLFLVGAVLATSSLSLLGTPPASVTFADGLPTSSAAAGALASRESDLLGAINDARASNGVAPLSMDPRLTEVARARSNDQVTRNYFSHTAPDGQTIFDLLAGTDLDWHTAGENLAESRGLDPVRAAIDGFLNSPAHRANVLNPAYNHVGVGAAMTSDETTILTVVFTD